MAVAVHQPCAHRPHLRGGRGPRLARVASACGPQPEPLLRRRTGFPDARGHFPTVELASAPRIPAHSSNWKMAGAPELEVLSPLGDVERAAGAEDRTSVPATTRQDFRVRCTSKRAVMELVELCSRFLQQLGDSLPDKIREPALRDAQWVGSQWHPLVTFLTPGLRVQGPAPGFSGVNGAPGSRKAARKTRGNATDTVSAGNY